jgi:hypothetical protein
MGIQLKQRPTSLKLFINAPKVSAFKRSRKERRGQSLNLVKLSSHSTNFSLRLCVKHFFV